MGCGLFEFFFRFRLLILRLIFMMILLLSCMVGLIFSFRFILM